MLDMQEEVDLFIERASGAGKKRLPTLYLLNFRSFKGFHAIELGEITLLYGSNSVGKSTLINAINEAFDVLSKRKSLSKSEEENRSHLAKINEPYGIGFGGVIFDGRIGFNDFFGKKSLGQIDFDDDIASSYPVIDFIRSTEYGGSACIWRNQKKLADAKMFNNVNGNSTFSPNFNFYTWSKTEIENFLWALNSTDNPNDFGYQLDIEKYLLDKLPESWGVDEILIDDAQGRSIFSCDIPDINEHVFYDDNAEWILGQVDESGAFDLLQDSPVGAMFLTLFHSMPTSTFLDDIWNRDPYYREGLKNIHLGALRKMPLDSDLELTFKLTDANHLASSYPISTKKRDKNTAVQNGTFIWEDASDNLLLNIYGDKEDKAHEFLVSHSRGVDRLEFLKRFLKNKNGLKSNYGIDYTITEEWELDKNRNYAKEKPSGIKVKFSLTENGKEVSFADVGTGFSQVLPVAYFLNQVPRCSISQPELHLHPKLASRLSSLLIERVKPAFKARVSCVADKDSYKDVVAKKSFWSILETHSEHILTPILTAIGKGKVNTESVRLYVLTKSKIQGTFVKRIRIDEDGDFIDNWPEGYFNETYL